jgi:hypothetical protein
MAKGRTSVIRLGRPVRDAMPAFFDLLTKETNPAPRVVLGHFIYVYIHPYIDVNGRTGRVFSEPDRPACSQSWLIQSDAG